MQLSARKPSVCRAFTLIELIVVIVVLAILSGIAIPKYIDYTANAKASACKGALGGMRSAIANFYANAATNGAPAFPTLVQIQTTGTVMQELLAANPYTNDATVAAATWNAVPPVAGASGWNYDVAVGRFWANSNTTGENTW